MVRSFPLNPFKLIIGLGVIAMVMVAAYGSIHPADPTDPNGLTASDYAWLKGRVARAPMPGPKADQPQVLLIWRAPEDAPRVRKIISQIDHPEGLDGVYGMDVLLTEPLAATLHASDLLQNQPTRGAWLIVLDKFGHQLGSTPQLTSATVNIAYEMARGAHVRFPGMADPYLGNDAPDFTTTTLDGKPFTLSSLRGKKVVMMFYCGCSQCQAMGKALAPIENQPPFKGVQFYTVTHMNAAQLQEFEKETGQKLMGGLSQKTQDIAALYDSHVCPRVWYIDPSGKVRYYSFLGEEPDTVTQALTNAVQGGKDTFNVTNAAASRI